MDNFYVEPGQSFFIEYTSDGTQESFDIPDITTDANAVKLAFNGIIQMPFKYYTVHQGRLKLNNGPVPAGFNIQIWT